MSATGILFYDPRAKPLSATGTYQPGCYLYFYGTGTLTQATVYADGGLTTPLSQPIVAAADGRFVPIYLNPATIYREQLYSSTNVLLEDVDPIVPGPNLSNYVTSSALTTALANYVTSTALGTTLAGYATTSALASYALLAGAAFTGTVTALTPAPGDNSTNVATTAFVQALGALTGSSTSGTFKIGSLIINFGLAGPSPGGGSSPSGQTVTFNTAFPTACLGIYLGAELSQTQFTSAPSASTSGFTMYAGVTGSYTPWLAIGH
jgi:hypothetical protein